MNVVFINGYHSSCTAAPKRRGLINVLRIAAFVRFATFIAISIRLSWANYATSSISSFSAVRTLRVGNAGTSRLVANFTRTAVVFTVAIAFSAVFWNS